MNKTISHVSINTFIDVEQYKLELFSEGVLPYIEDMNRKLFIDSDRFHQIKVLY